MKDESETPPRPGVGSWILLCCCGTTLAGVCLLLGQDAGRFADWVWLAAAGGSACGGLVVWAAWHWRRFRVGACWLLAVLAAAVLLRVSLWPADRYLSDDIYRYHWDGKVLAAGINPYRYAPQDPALDPLRGDDFDVRINHPGYHTVYPPLAELLFAAGYALSPGRLAGLRLLLLLSELACWGLLLAEMGRRGLPRSGVLLAAWLPLALFEGHLPGHVDSLALPGIALFVLWLDRDRALPAAAALAAVVLIKPLALIFVPAAVRQVGLRRAALAGAAFAMLIAGAYLPFIAAGEHLFSSMWAMAAQWSFNGSLAGVLEALLPKEMARSIAAGLLALLIGLGTWRGRDLLSRLLLAYAAFAICSPNLLPWYLIGLLPLLVLRPDPALLWLAVSIPVTEVVMVGWRQQQLWQLPLWASLLQFLPFFALLALGAWRGWGAFAASAERPRL